MPAGRNLHRWSRCARLSLRAAVVAIAAACLAASPAAPAVFEIDLPAEIDGRSLGTILVGVEGSELVSVDAASLRDLGQRAFADALLGRVLPAGETGAIPVGTLRERGLEVALEPVRTVVVFTVPDELRRADSIGLGTEAGDGALRRSDSRVEGYLSAILTQDFVVENTDAGTGRQPFGALLDGAVRLFGEEGLAIEGSLTYDEDEDEAFRRGPIRLLHDDTETAIRYSAGDLQYLRAEVQSSPDLLGLSIERNYSEIQPLRVVSSTGTQSFTLRSRATVEIYVNDVFQRLLRLDAGRYSIDDFAFADGLNDIRVVVIDDAGRREVLEFTLFLDAQLLKEGLLEFSVNGGYQRDTESFGGSPDYDFGEPGWSGFLRYGVTDFVTLGASYQGDLSLDLAGVEAVVSTPVGIFAGTYGQSRSEEFGTGHFGALRYSVDLAPPVDADWADLVEIDLGGQFESARYATLGEEEPSNPFGLELFGRISTGLPFDTRATLSARYGETREAGEDDEFGIGLALSRSFGAATVQMRYEHDRGERPEHRGFVTVSFPFGERGVVRSSWSSENNQTTLEVARFGSDVVGDVSGSALVTGSEDGFEGLGEVLYRGNRGVARAEYSVVQRGLDEGSREQRARLELGTALAFTEDAVAIGRPIGDAFAIVRRHPTLGDAEVRVNPSIDGRPVAVADGLGPAVVPNFVSYVPQRLEWDVTGAPAGYDLGETALAALPSYRGGIGAMAGSAASYTVLGIASGPDGAPLALVAGRVVPADGRAFPERRTFTNRAGRFAVQALEPGRYRMTLGDGFAAEFEVAGDGGNFVDLGEIRGDG